jgi:proline dehydrogenase
MIATHDPRLVEIASTLASRYGRDQGTYEFQMLYGIRRDLQASLVQQGFKVRVYIPFGREWFPYFMRRLGERPANIGFVMKSLVRET